MWILPEYIIHFTADCACDLCGPQHPCNLSHCSWHCSWQTLQRILQTSHSVHLQVVGVIAAALEKHAAHAVPSQAGALGVGMQAASGVCEATAAQQADHTASAASAIGDVSVIAMEVRCRRSGSSLTFCEVMIVQFTALYAVLKSHMVLSMYAWCVSSFSTSATVVWFVHRCTGFCERCARV